MFPLLEDFNFMPKKSYLKILKSLNVKYIPQLDEKCILL